ncbi:MAG: OadG-related small transporter subunit [Sphaerochaetaceae bacterium]|nr:OadG-related small transporter subunit [Sphaerochaetaceae bacterium]MDC7247881.1 OadG-related small transporter subunit [Sphaerochaetaceae bacterium]
MLDTVRQSLTLMWQGMGAIFLVIFVIYLLLLAFPKIFKNK